jgi:hypothetical protein
MFGVDCSSGDSFTDGKDTLTMVRFLFSLSFFSFRVLSDISCTCLS